MRQKIRTHCQSWRPSRTIHWEAERRQIEPISFERSLGQNRWVDLVIQSSERTRKGEFSSKSSSWELHLAKKSYFYKWEFCSEWFRDPHHWVFWALTLYSLWPKHVRHYVRLPTEALNFFSHGGNVIFSNNWGFKKTCSGSRMGSTLFPPINFKRIRLSSFPSHWSPLLDSLHT